MGHGGDVVVVLVCWVMEVWLCRASYLDKYFVSVSRSISCHFINISIPFVGWLASYVGRSLKAVATASLPLDKDQRKNPQNFRWLDFYSLFFRNLKYVCTFIPIST